MADTGRQVNIKIPEAMYKGLSDMAQKAGVQPSTYAGTLLCAAYTARVKPPSGDRDLDAIVGMVTVLWAEKRDTASIAAVVGLKAATVEKIIAAWQRQFRNRAVGGAAA